MGAKMKPMCNSMALWAPAARGTSRGLAPPAPFCFEVVGSGRGTEKTRATPYKNNLTAHETGWSRAAVKLYRQPFTMWCPQKKRR